MGATTATRQDGAVSAVPTGAALGAEVRGIDLRHVTDAQFDAIHRAWLAHSVLLFRGQALSDDDLVAFSRRCGDLGWAPAQENGRRFVEGKPEIYIVSNVLGPDGQAIGSLGAGEAVWHTDMSYLERPPEASMLYALEVPPAGGDTHFCSMYAAYEELPEALKQRIAGLRVKHDGTYNSGGFLRAGMTPTDGPRTSPLPPAPAGVPAPGDGGAAMLYLGRRRNAYVDGLPLEESEALLDELWGYATRAEIAWAHRWRPGDLVLWDNRCTMHRRDPFDAASRRVMHRTRVKGEAPPAA